MESTNEFFYGKKVADALKKLETGLKSIELENKEIFEETPFSKYYIIQYPPQAMLTFTKRSEILPVEIIEKTKALCNQIAKEVANQ